MTAPFGTLALAPELEHFTVHTAAGPLTAFRVLPAGPRRGVALLVPGFTGSKEDFRLLLPLIAAHGWEAVSYSQRGQADSAAPAGIENYRLEDFAADAVTVAHEIGAGGAVHLVGHSLGGLVARAALLHSISQEQSPAQFADLTMLCSGPGGRAGVHAANAALVAEHGTLAVWALDHPEGSPLTADDVFVRDRLIASSVDNILGGARILDSTPDTTDAVRASAVPTLVAHGDSDDAWPIPSQRLMAEQLGAQYRVIPQAGHLPNLDNPGFTAAMLNDFWASTS
ncbi:alpha/beta hydrolase [Cryobacterium zongtaii]|uniref:Alpha/beta hydrolase n=1 Tax=Cryobacterium zongtaii TaxID=1259217 RepID=A0A2S3ZQY6_9MICO|nr:alpha/beta fold hydrolase [Cryobacterium zongtaii]POH71307.1 alpha/beta hydrolase [Cryobacterium zongtaii]